MKAALPLALCASLCAAAIAGCSTETKSFSGLDSRPQPVTKAMAYKPGTGVVESWTATPGSTSAAGASGRVDPTGPGMLRMGIRMDDGTVQYVDTESRDFPVGTRVRLTEDKLIERM